MSEVKLLKEGDTFLFVSDHKTSKRGPGRKEKNKVFYNPAMDLSRDFSVLMAQWFVNAQDKRVKILDGLASCGARGLRIGNEVEGDFEIIINDWDEKAYNLIKKGIEFNKISHARASCKNFHVVTSEEKFDFIDIDPFGTPVPYLDSAIRGLKSGGIIAFTATDTATLCGVYPKTCIRRYFAIPFHSWMMHEIGLRILIGYACREAAKHDRGIDVLLSHSTDHYMRVFLRVWKGAKKAENSLDNVKKVNLLPYVNRNVEIGPIWTGKLHNTEVLQSLKKIAEEKKLSKKKEVEKLLRRMIEEVDMPLFFYRTDVISSELSKSPPKLSRIIKLLREEGYKASRTQFANNAFKTDAPREVIYRLFMDL